MDRLYELLAQWRSASALFFLTLLLAVSATPAAWAGSCSLDDRPGATLLLPYFEVDLDDPLGRTTLFSVNNAAAAVGAGQRGAVDRPRRADAELSHLPDRLRRADGEPARRVRRHRAADGLGHGGPRRHAQPARAVLAGHRFPGLRRPAAPRGAAGQLPRAPAGLPYGTGLAAHQRLRRPEVRATGWRAAT